MSTELVYRMRTCAAALAGNGDPSPVLLRDACDLLIEASNLIDAPDDEPLGEPMEMIASKPIAQWGGQLDATARACPSCGSVDARTVKRDGRRLMLTCPMCAHTWEYGK